MLSDPKIKHLSAVEKWIWVGLLLMANEGKPRGTIKVCENMPYSLPILASMLDLYGDEVDRLDPALEKMQRMDMLTVDDDGFIIITHFDERQYTYHSNTPEEVAKRVKKHRKKKGNDSATTKQREQNNIDIDIDIDIEEDKDIVEPIDLLSRYERHIGYRFRGPGGWPSKKELKGSKELLDLGYTAEQVCACHDWLKEQEFWRNRQISLHSILKQIDFYVKKHPKTTKEVEEAIPDL